MADLFGQNFQFYTGNRQQSKNSTCVGMFFTVTIIILTSSYLIWLIDGLANNRFLPKVNIQAHLFDENESSFTFENMPPFLLQIEFDEGVPEGFKFEDYFDFEITHGHKDKPHTRSLPWKKCSQIFPELQELLEFRDDEYCIDLKSILLDFGKPRYYIKVIFKACTGKPNCKPLDEIYQMIQDYPVDIKPQKILQEIQYKTKTLLTTRQNYYVKGDQDIIHVITGAARKSHLQIDDGLILSTAKQDDYIYQVDMLQQTYERQYMLHDPAFASSFMIFDYELSENGKLLVVEYPKLPEMLAQANSVFITLIAITGITVKVISKVKIQESIVDIHINYYYTGLKKLLFNYQDPLKFNQAQTVKFSTFSSLGPYLKKFFYRFGNSGNKQTQQNKESVKDVEKTPNQVLTKEKIYDQVHQVAVKNMELRQIYREILELKTQVQLLYDDQSYAAVRYCQRSFIDPNKMYETKEKAYKQANHLEKMDLIDRYDDINQEIFQKFLDQQEQNQQSCNQSSILYQHRNRASTAQQRLSPNQSIKNLQKPQSSPTNDLAVIRWNMQYRIRKRIHNCLDQQIINKYKIQQENENDQQQELSVYINDSFLLPTSIDQNSQMCTSRLGQYIVPPGDLDGPPDQKFL